MGILESLLSAEWVKEQIAENAFELIVWTLVVVGIGFAAGYKVGQWRTRNKEAEEKFVLLDKYIVENAQLSQDLKIANHRLENALVEATKWKTMYTTDKNTRWEISRGNDQQD